jgi:hypothetical protein
MRMKPASSWPTGRILAAFLVLVCVLVGVGALFSRFSHSSVPPTPLPVVARTNLELRGACWYRPKSTNAFTGWLVSYYADGTLLSKCSVSNGLLNGICEGWYTNHQLQSCEYFSNSISSGERQRWFENGALESEAQIVSGTIEGTFKRWYDNGQLAEQIEMVHGRPNGFAVNYYSNGYLKAETQVDDGTILQQKRWKEEQHQLVPTLSASR